jgi:hypothetical protein
MDGALHSARFARRQVAHSDSCPISCTTRHSPPRWPGRTAAFKPDCSPALRIKSEFHLHPPHATYRPRTSARASSMRWSSSASRRPALRPKRWGSTTVVCSTSTRVAAPPRVIVGRKLAAWALIEVGETSTVLNPRTRRLGRSPHNERRAALGHVSPAEMAGEGPRRAPRQSMGSGASSAICSRIARISARSASSAASRSTSATIDERIRRLAAASHRATRTASELLSPSLLTTLSAAAELSSSLTWRERPT